MKTGAPSGTVRMSSATLSFAARTQPFEAATPSGPEVPWIAIVRPPNQPDGRFGCVALRATAQQPYRGYRPPRPKEYRRPAG